MKSTVRKKQYNLLLIGLYFALPIVGWLLGGVFMAIIGLLFAYITDLFFPKWEHELTWKEIDIALNNLYKHGLNPSYFGFYVENRKLFVYRDERGNKKHPIRMAVSIPIEDWSDLLDQNDYDELLNNYGGVRHYSTNRGKGQYDIFTKSDREGPDDCKAILKYLFKKAVGGLRPEIMAQSNPNTKKVIWLDHVSKKNA